MINGHGNDQYNYPNIVADFSSNILPTGIHHEIKKHIQKHVDAVNNYPDPNNTKFIEAVAKHHHLRLKNVVPCNGSIEGIYHIAQLFQRKKSQIVIPAFSEYEDSCTMYNHTLSFCNELEDISKDTQLVWIGNPANPTGKVTPIGKIKKLCNENPEITFVIDETYAELNPFFESAVPFIPQLPNIIVMKSLTKSFCIPGLRIGYLLTSEKLAQQIKALSIPWSVNELAIQTGTFILNNYDKLLPNIKDIHYQSLEFQQQLQEFDEIKITPSDCNFFLAELKAGKASELKDKLANNYGILIRDASNFRGLSECHFRLSTQNKEHNSQLISALKQLFTSEQ